MKFGQLLVVDKRLVVVEVNVLICVGFPVIHLEFGKNLPPAGGCLHPGQAGVVGHYPALCLHCELNFGILLVQKVDEVGDALLFDHFDHII